MNKPKYKFLHNNKLSYNNIKDKNKKHKKFTGHFTLIIGETNDEYYFLTLTHSKKYHRRINIPLINNPNKNDRSQAYLTKIIKHMNKKNFTNTGKHLTLSPEDEKIIDMFLEKERLKKMKDFELKLNEVYELQNKYADNSKWLRNQKTIIVTDEQAKIYDENDSIRNKIENIFQDEKFVNELNNQVKNNYAKLEQME